MLKSIINILLILAFFQVSAQKALAPKLPEVQKPERQIFVRFGVDLSRIAVNYIGKIPYQAFEASVDGEVVQKYFPTFEAGWSKLTNSTVNISAQDPAIQYNYQMSGTYYRVGMNYNMLKYKQHLDRNIFFVGARLATSGFSQEASQVSLTNAWGTLETSFPKTSLHAYWFEGVIGLRGEVVRNLYMGYTIRIKRMIAHSGYNGINPYIIPGYGKGSKSSTVGISYSIFYAIPIKNPKINYPKKNS